MNELYLNRFAKVRSAMTIKGLKGLIISDPQSIWYLTGIDNDPYERLYALYIEREGNAKLFANKLFNIPENEFEVIWYTDSDNAAHVLADNTLKEGIVGVDKILPARFLIPLMARNKNTRYAVGSFCVDDARGCKDSEEQKLMFEASRINDVCIKHGFEFIHEGVTEKQVAEYISKCFKDEGADSLSFDTIVSFGANAADPHHTPDDTVIKAGDCVLIDMGCRKNHYCSDMTRTNFYRYADDEYAMIHEIVREAHEKAVSMIKPGVRFCDIDAAARNYIDMAGYGEYFTHRLGHFCGQTDHEQGDVSASNTNVTEAGMIFSIEPGVYIPGKVGVRIEDLVMVTESGCVSLNNVDKKWQIVGINEQLV